MYKNSLKMSIIKFLKIEFIKISFYSLKRRPSQTFFLTSQMSERRQKHF